MFGRPFRIALAAAFASCTIVGGLLLLSDDAEAVHFWSGSLSWERLLPEEVQELAEPVSTAIGTEGAVRITGYLSWDSTQAQYQTGGVGCDKVVGTIIPQDSVNFAFLYVNGVKVDYAMKVVYADANTPPIGHCRFAGKIIDPSQVGTELGVVVPMPPGVAGPIEVWWGRGPLVFCCREDLNHVNNPNIAAVMSTLIVPGDPNSSPVIDFPSITKITSHGAYGYGNHHCPKNAFCKFYIYASDPDNDTLTWRKATSDEASADPTAFKHPGAPWTGPFDVDRSTGLVTWDTTGASVGQIYSTQIIVEDGATKVPVDFMVEIGPGCENGATGVLDPITGELICEKDPPPPPPPDPPCQQNPDGDGCRPVPPPPPQGKEYQHQFWPPPQRNVVMAPVASDSQSAEASPSDDNLDSLSKLDSDDDDIDDALDLCPGSDTLDNGDLDGDGRGDGCDEDDDNDGILDEMDACPDDPEPRCGLDGTGKDVAGGEDAAQGFLVPSDAVEKGSAQAPVQAAASEAPQALPLLGVLAAAFVLLLLVGARRRRSE